MIDLMEIQRLELQYEAHPESVEDFRLNLRQQTNESESDTCNGKHSFEYIG